MKLKLMPILVGAVTLTLAATPFMVNAQANTSGQQLLAQGQGQRQGKFADLNLTQDQKDKIAQIHKDTRSQMQAVLTPDQRNKLNAARENGQGRQGRRAAMAALNLTDAQKTQMRTIRESAKSKIQAVLTAEQRQQWEQKTQQWRQQRNQNQSRNN
jgi:Spy/CpxP family protein refolding chaperone